eukprot:6179120-Pleurochrysis_carterae.AAC.4
MARADDGDDGAAAAAALKLLQQRIAAIDGADAAAGWSAEMTHDLVQLVKTQTALADPQARYAVRPPHCCVHFACWEHLALINSRAQCLKKTEIILSVPTVSGCPVALRSQACLQESWCTSLGCTGSSNGNEAVTDKLEGSELRIGPSTTLIGSASRRMVFDLHATLSFGLNGLFRITGVSFSEDAAKIRRQHAPGRAAVCEKGQERVSRFHVGPRTAVNSCGAGHASCRARPQSVKLWLLPNSPGRRVSASTAAAWLPVRA